MGVYKTKQKNKKKSVTTNRFQLLILPTLVFPPQVEGDKILAQEYVQNVLEWVLLLNTTKTEDIPEKIGNDTP